MTHTILSAAFANPEHTAAVLQTVEAGAVLVSEVDTPVLWAQMIEATTPTDYAAPNQRPIAEEEYKVERETMLGRIGGIAGRAQRRGDLVFATALDALAERLIVLHTHPLVLAAPDHDLEALRDAYVAAYNQEAMAALMSAPDSATRLAWKLEVDKVSK